ncbi:DUF4260 family protein [Devosia nitrariae]|uniref:DUF4260 family protein n=1 Tax=Devosia nitrariae TaxID=2071872 RepID=A0ABQ5WE73_9HYPH|nr:DUF4260 family protein [Devosia nitrariae]GLQ58188.1 hypothetical protein GCM10010862_54470 [Devosia nitrariae]
MSANGGNGYVTGMAREIVRAEGLAVFLAATIGFFFDGGAWWLYLVLFLAPDLSFLAYAAGTRLGAVAYNVFHSYALPVLLALAGWSLGSDGLKYPTAFGHTHLGPVGRAKAGLSMPS